ncbi:MAG: aminotransferase class IV [Geopsychrobacter sp.]|nr:aminotransferase class IV [Geopsychrobacter sp.]
MSYVYLNDEFVQSERAKISVFDQGFLYGDGIYESFRSIDAQLYQFSHHYQRLCQSAEALNYRLPHTQQQLEQILRKLRQRNELKNAYYRLTITRGRGEIGFQRENKSDPTCLIIAREFKEFAAEHYQQGIALRVAQIRRNAPEAINPKIKSISNLNSLLGKLEAKTLNAFEVIMLNNKDLICEGAASNIFWSKGGWVFTPSEATGLLEGVTRSTIIRLCETQLNLRVISGEYKLQDMLFADEVFITSTSLEVMPVIRVDDFTINQGEVGPVARRLRAALHRDMGR